MATPTEVPRRIPTYQLSLGTSEVGHQLFLAELDPRATIGTTWITGVAGDGSIRQDVGLPGLNLVSIEIFNELEFKDPGGDPRKVQFRPVEFVFANDPVFSTVTAGLHYDGSDVGELPGIETDFDEAGYMLRLRVERAGFVGTDS